MSLTKNAARHPLQPTLLSVSAMTGVEAPRLATAVCGRCGQKVCREMLLLFVTFECSADTADNISGGDDEESDVMAFHWASPLVREGAEVLVGVDVTDGALGALEAGHVLELDRH